MSWKVIDSGVNHPKENMKKDCDLLASLDREFEPILHLYDWKGDAVTYGHFILPEKHFLSSCTYSLAKRPTGGGILFHRYDFAFSLLVPATHPFFSANTLECYRKVNTWVAEIIEMFSGKKAALCDKGAPQGGPFCQALATVYDVAILGKKVAGAAQRRGRFGFLHQGSIALFRPEKEYLNRALIQGDQIFEKVNKEMSSLCGDYDPITALKEKSRLKECFFNHKFGKMVN